MLKRLLILVHRWLGVALCLFFILWFPSGIGMMYFRYPTISPADRLERSPAIDPSRVAIPPAEAAEKLYADPPQLRLTTFDGRPAYRLAGGGPVIFADTGEELDEISMETVRRLASAWTGQPAATATEEEVQGVDQWTLQTRLADLAPIYKFTWPDGEQVYVSQAAGEVVQYTTTGSRLGAYLGPIPHWLYFTPLRKHGREWSRLVIWTSGIGTISALLGVIIGVWMYSPQRKYRYAGSPTGIPYRGQKRWHTIFGLAFGIATATYAFSGLLSMDPFPSITDRTRPVRGRDEPNVFRALRGQVSPDGYTRHPREAIEALGALPVKELEFTSFAGDPVYLARLGTGETRIVPMQGPPQSGFEPDDIVRVVQAASTGRVTTTLLTQYDRYYLDRTRRQPLPVVLAQSTTGSGTRFYIDPKTARVVQTYNPGNWITRWLYNGLHSLNFPWLYNYRPLWDIVVITLMLGGTALCVTSLVLAWRVLGRWIARALRSSDATGDPALSEDLA